MKSFIFVRPVNSSSYVGSHMPIYLVDLAGLIRKKNPGIDVRILDMVVDYGFPQDHDAEAVINRKAISDLVSSIAGEQAIVGVSAISMNELVAALPIAQAIKKETGTTIVFGGYAPTIAYKILLEDYDFIDSVCIGAGEAACIELARQLHDGKIRFDKVPGMAYRLEKEITLNPKAGQFNINELPEPDLSSLSDPDAYYSIAYNTAVGCPYNCNFCFEKAVHPKCSIQSADKVMKTLDAIYGQIGSDPYIFFADPVFRLGTKKAGDMALKLKSRDWKYSIELRCEDHDPALFNHLKGNCKIINYGVESGSGKTLLKMQKTVDPGKYLETLKKNIITCNECGIMPIMLLLPNYPTTTDQELTETLDYFTELRALFEKNPVSGTGPGFMVIPMLPFIISPGGYHDSRLKELEADGMTCVQSFPDEYHGIRIRPEMQRFVHNPSSSLPLDKVLGTLKKLHELSFYTEQAQSIILKYMNVNLMPAIEKSDLFLSKFTAEKPGLPGVIDVAAIVKNKHELWELFPEPYYNVTVIKQDVHKWHRM